MSQQPPIQSKAALNPWTVNPGRITACPASRDPGDSCTDQAVFEAWRMAVSHKAPRRGILLLRARGRPRQPMQRADWIALAGVVLSVLLSVAALVVAYLSLREDREANEWAAAPPTASLRLAGDPKIRLRKDNVEWNKVPA